MKQGVDYVPFVLSMGRCMVLVKMCQAMLRRVKSNEGHLCGWVIHYTFSGWCVVAPFPFGGLMQTALSSGNMLGGPRALIIRGEILHI